MTKTKLQKQLSRKFKGKEYHKYVVTLPPKHIQKLGWEEGVELEAVIENEKIILKPKER